MSIFKKKEMIQLAFIIPLLFLLLTYYTGAMKGIRSDILSWGPLIVTFTYFLGLATVFRHNILKIQKKERDWQYLPLLFIGFFAVLISKYTSQPSYDWLINKLLLPMQIAMLGYVGIYFFTMYFRGARTRNWAATVVLGSAIFTMFGNAPIGPGIHPVFAQIFMWIKDVPNTAGMRGLLIGMGTGIILTVIRKVMGQERALISGEAENV